MEDDYGAPDMPDMPDFEIEEHAIARPSAAHSAPGDVLGTPIRTENNESGMLEFDTPVIELKKGKAAASKRRRGHILDESTEIPTAKMREWVMDENSVLDLLREPRSLPKTSAEAAKRHNEELLKKGKLVETLSREPLSGLMGQRLREVLASLGTKSIQAQQPDNARKRKSSVQEPEQWAAPEGDEARDMGDVAQQDNVWDAPDMPDYGYQPDMDFEQQQHQEDEQEVAPAAQARSSRAMEDSVFEEYVKDDEEEQEEGPGRSEDGKVTEQAERTKKVIVMLQKSFRKSENKVLQFRTMIQGSSVEAPSRHTAAVAFFELLGLHAKGMVKLDQKDAFGDIAIGQTQLLMKQKA